MRLVHRDDGKEWERVVFAEVLVPNVVNTFGDIYTPDAIKDFAYEFARQGYGIDVDHDRTDVTGDVYVVESFIARSGDPDFIEGSWVVGMKVPNDEIWSAILAGELNGYSYEALVNMIPVLYTTEENRTIVGRTEPHPDDGHTHTYVITLDSLNRPLAGATSSENGHSHKIATHTITEVSDGHNHRFQVIETADTVETLEE
jgi:hypothetical protein